ncbi:UDP-N-acetylmuramoyl-tripeptide--D-alanyl-D-alanine ligase [Ramlibacter sp. H39-3-26]|uniref:UDP-N-acetylmuramoyl-tripeptide--D-alanyl-D- alanine ligase n=1 Tax=Curvibacter soli TaxID=3031331 RepID=UPI0023DC6432|nr:UDP-N-acetylmuramoyl-tripeptide--D-alanyl-D-alanine ligase [Ramlibacter sp. H39-3-26]MDF1484681.1 UDP-N-acetylmuramoyl-tripeptide--D-alanyl-D-alanine ligase [Ramlibacter sp. H39-3-26]
MSAVMATLQQAQAWIPGAQRVGDGATAFTRVHTDTRSLRAGDLFVALRGERFDAHDFLAAAREAGAVAAIAERGLATAGLPGLTVPDSRLALGALAAAWRARFTLPLIAVTGSNGKTTVTQMVASILRAWLGDAAFATQGNLNNDVGVPLTLLRLRAGHRAGVVELGMNHPGEIAYLAPIARPTVALVNNAQREHQEFMGTVEAVARENGQAIAALPADGVAVFPADDAYTAPWQALAGARRCITFADAAGVPAQVRTVAARWLGDGWALEAATPAGPLVLRLGIAGRHNVKNALAATACALAAGAPLVAVMAGLAAFEPVKGRSRAFQATIGGSPVTVVDDTYNANPDSMRAAVDVLAALPGPQLLVVGDMGEVGSDGPAFHAELGAYARERGIPALYALGAQSAATVAAFGGAGRHFGDMAALQAAVAQALGQPSGAASVLVKGSRFMRMERVVEAIAAAATPHHDGEKPPCC